MLGKLNQRATVLARTLSPDGGGGHSESWDAVASVWARLEPVSAADRFTADKLESRARHRLTLRRSNALAAGQRVQLGARLFAVRALLDPGPQSPFVTLSLEELP